MTPLTYSYDPEQDVMTIQGIRYSGDLFRKGLGPTAPGWWVRVERARDGVMRYTFRHERLIRIPLLDFFLPKRLR